MKKQQSFSSSRFNTHAEQLESRRLLSAVDPTPNEQLFIELLNRARANPPQFAIDFGVSVPLTDAAPQPPLAVNAFLTDSARGHAQEMATFNYFGHQSAVTGKWPNQMARDAGYVLPTWWDGANNYIESIAAGSFSGYTSALEPLKALLVDGNSPNPGHRIHLLAMDAWNQNFEEVGVGYGNSAASTYQNYWAIQTGYTENVSGKFLTGVAFNDSVTADNFYTVGEQIGGATITATRTSDNAVFTTTTFSSGGYSLRLTPGTYNITASGAGFASPVTTSGVVMGGANKKLDFIPVAAVPPVLTGSEFNVNTREVRYFYSLPIAPESVVAGDLEMTNTTLGQTTHSATAASVQGSTVIFTLPTTMTDGNYRFRIPSGAISASNGAATSAHSDSSQFILRGDATRNRSVDFDDLLLLAQNYGQSGRTFQQGDFDYNGTVNFDDLLALAQRYGTSLVSIASPPSLKRDSAKDSPAELLV